jgi:hypothetical protein
VFGSGLAESFLGSSPAARKQWRQLPQERGPPLAVQGWVHLPLVRRRLLKPGPPSLSATWERTNRRQTRVSPKVELWVSKPDHPYGVSVLLSFRAYVSVRFVSVWINESSFPSTPDMSTPSRGSRRSASGGPRSPSVSNTATAAKFDALDAAYVLNAGLLLSRCITDSCVCVSTLDWRTCRLSRARTVCPPILAPALRPQTRPPLP